MHVNDIPTPAMLLDIDVLTANISAMADKAKMLGVRLRPHIKTHKCFNIARLQMEHGAAGITVSTLTEAEELAKFLSAAPGLQFAGLLTHAGHAYSSKSTTEIRFIVGEEQRIMGVFAERLAKQGITVPAVSIGSTPSIAFTTGLQGIDEIRPGNYVFHDRTQLLLGSCELGNCAARILTSVISVQPGAGHAVIDAGALALSHDPGPTHLGLPASRGALFDLGGKQLDRSLMVDAVSQEHGFVRGQNPADVELLKMGERLEILPNHSCLAAPLFDTYYIVRGDDVVDQWPVMRRR